LQSLSAQASGLCCAGTLAANLIGGYIIAVAVPFFTSFSGLAQRITRL
jgi:hypothetical protein